ncbi:MAG: type II toxin-antitoxin system Phd/YefM family antitoxin [Deltaproteobacteria bacterium]|jgi:prevent-host-death family protein|nr:type II toxin-antitoxin system Phd/YefM family antitoxin [Deltaproteobacteria bacterium]
MKDITVSITEGRKKFSRLVHGALNNKEKIIITKRQKPVAVIIPYDEYRRSMRFEGYKKIIDAREAFLKAGVKAKDVYKESQKQLEHRS